MTIREMHYDFKMKINKVDSEKYQNLDVPEIDWALREAESMFIQQIVSPFDTPRSGIEKTQRNIDDIRTLLKKQTLILLSEEIALPSDYMFYVSSIIDIQKGDCRGEGIVVVRQHDDEFEKSPFDQSSFEWREVNAVFYENKIKFFPQDFQLNNLHLTYIKEPVRMHNAQDYEGGSYTTHDGVVLTGGVDCELPDHTHAEIVNIAVFNSLKSITHGLK